MSELKPCSYAYRYPDGIRYGTGGSSINGSYPIETTPVYWGPDVNALQAKLADIETRHQAEIAAAYLAAAPIANKIIFEAVQIVCPPGEESQLGKDVADAIISLTPDAAKKALALREAKIRVETCGEIESRYKAMRYRPPGVVESYKAELESAVRELGGKV